MILRNNFCLWGEIYLIEPNLTLFFFELYFGKFVFLLIVLDVLQLKAILAEPFYQFFLQSLYNRSNGESTNSRDSSWMGRRSERMEKVSKRSELVCERDEATYVKVFGTSSHCQAHWASEAPCDGMVSTRLSRC